MDGEQNLNSQSEQSRVWSLDEIRKHSANWSLAGDIGLYNFLNEFSQYIISRTHEVQNALDSLVHETKMTSAQINNVINDFHMLSNTQFVENRVYDEEIHERVPEVVEPEKTKEQKEAEMLPKFIKAVDLGLSVLDTAFDHINVNEISDSEDEDVSSGGRTILEPKDPYEHRPLPYIIGSEEFMKCDYAGLKDLIEDEVLSSEESITTTSDETTSDEGEPLPLDEEERVPRKPVDRLSQDMDKVSSSDESELFGSEKEENEPPLITKPVEQKNVQRKEEETEEPKERLNSVSSLQSRLKLPQVLPVPKLQNNEKNDLFTNDDDDDEGDLFEDLPFRKRTGLFTSAAHFDTAPENEDGDLFGGDLFDRTSKNEKKIEKAETKSVIPSGMVKTPLAAIVAQKKDSQLFADDEDSDEDIFSTLIQTEAPMPVKERNAGSQDSSEKADTSSTPSSAPSTKPSGNMFDFDTPAGNASSLFKEDSDEDLFSSKNTKKIFGFDTSEKIDSLDTSSKTSKPASENKAKSSPLIAPAKKTELKLFDDDDDDGDDLFSQVKKTDFKSTANEKKSSALFDEFSNSEIVKSTAKTKVEDEKLSLFDDDSFMDGGKEFTLSKDLGKAENVGLFSDINPTSNESKNLFSEESSDNDLFSPKEMRTTQTVISTKKPKEEVKDLFSEESSTADIFSSRGTKIVQTVDSAKLSTLTTEAINPESQIGFDAPADSSNLLNVINKDRVRITTKRRKPTRKKLVASEDTEKEEKPAADSPSMKEERTTTNVPEEKESPVKSVPKGGIYHEQERKKMNLMSQLITEASESRLRKTTPALQVGLSSDADQSKSTFSFTPPEKSDVSSFFSLDINKEKDILITSKSSDSLDNLIQPASQNVKSSSSQKDFFPNLDSDDDDLFSSANIGLPKNKPDFDNASSLFDDDNDIFADLHKEKYEIFPSQTYEDDDYDIFSNLDTSIKPSGTGSNETSSTIKKVDKKAVNVFDDPLSDLLGEN